MRTDIGVPSGFFRSWDFEWSKSQETRIMGNETENLVRETHAPFRLTFPDLPGGEDYRIHTLEYRPGIYMFGYLSELIRWLQPNDMFYLGPLRETLAGRVSIWELLLTSIKSEPGLMTCAILGLIMSILVPLTGLIVCCCRLKRKNIKNRRQRNTRCIQYKRRSLELLLIFFLLVTLTAIILLLVANERLNTGINHAETLVTVSLDDLGSLIRNTQMHLRMLVTGSVDSTTDAIIADVDNAKTLLGRSLQAELATETQVESVFQSLRESNKMVTNLIASISGLQSMVATMRLQAKATDGALQDWSRNLQVVIQRCSPEDQILCSTVEVAALRIVADFSTDVFSKPLSYLKRSQEVDIENCIRRAQNEFNQIPTLVDKQSSEWKATVKRSVRDYKGWAHDMSRRLDPLVLQWEGILGRWRGQSMHIVSLLQGHETGRWLLGLGVGLIFVVVWFLLLLGLCCGCFSGKVAASKPSCAGCMGGWTLLTVVGLILFLSSIFWLVVVAVFVLGSHSEAFVCGPLYDEPEFRVLSQIQFTNNSLVEKLPETLKACREQKSAYSVFQLQRWLNLDEVVQYQSRISVSTLVDGLRFNFTGLSLLTPDLESSFQSSQQAFDYDWLFIRNELQKPLTNRNAQLIMEQLEHVGRRALNATTTQTVGALATKLGNILIQHLHPLEHNRDKLVSQFDHFREEIANTCVKFNYTTNNLDVAQNYLQRYSQTLVNRRAKEFGHRVVAYLEQFATHIVASAHDSSVHCKPLWDLYETGRVAVCRYMVDPLNGCWFSTFMCLLVLLVTCTVADKLASHYRLHKRRPEGEESPPTW